MTSDASSLAIDVAEVDSQSATDASLAPLEPSSSHIPPTPRHSQPRKRDMDGDNQSQDPPSGSFGQFSFAPATQTTVVTTTTTTTTAFPPLMIKPPKAAKDLDPKLYPLAASPTPDLLRNVNFELGGKSVVFAEPENSANAVNETKEKNDALKASNGLLRSVTSYSTSDKTASPRRFAHPRLSRQPSNHPASSKRRPVSPVSIPEAQALPRTRSRIPSEPVRSSMRSCGPITDGLATPETESNGLSFENSHPRRRIHSAAIPHRESHLRSPLSSEVEPQWTSQSSSNLSFGGQTAQAKSSASGKKNHWLDRSSEIDSSKQQQQKQQGSRKSKLDTHIEDDEELAEASQDQESGDLSEATSQPQKWAEPSSQLTATPFGSQDISLPSPSLSPVTAMNAMNADSFDVTEDPAVDTDSSLENNTKTARSITNRGVAKTSNPGQPSAAQTDNSRSMSSLMNTPDVLDFFDSVPEGFKTYLMYQFLRRCPKPTLRFVAGVVNPTLKCDFLSMLPLELSLNIVKYFDFQTMCRAAQVSKKWRTIVDSDERTWKGLLDGAGYVLPEGELERAIREGWGWQFPSGNDDWEKDISTTLPLKGGLESSSLASPTAVAGYADRMSVSRRPKRKAATRTSSRKSAKRKISSSGTENSENDWRFDIATTEGPYAAATAAATAVPYPNIGLPSLRSLHLYKSIYQRYHCIHRGWMKPDFQPKHVAFRAHDRHVVTCLQFDTDKILTGSDDTNINVYDTKTGALRTTLEGHEGGVWALEYYGNTLVSGSTDRSVRVWDIERARCTQVFHGHTSTVRCLQIVLPSPVGKRADGTVVTMPKEPLIITGSRDSNLRVWKLPKPGDPFYFETGPHVDDEACPYFVRVLTGHSHSVRAIAAHGDTLVSGSYDCTVRVWRISTGETVHRLQGHTSKVYSVVLDHKRNRCISGSMDNLVKVWSLDTGSILFNLEGHTSLVGLLDLKWDRLVSAAADSTLRIWDPDTGRCKSMLSAHTGAITCFQHDGQKVISGSDQTLKMWDVQTGDHVRDLLTDLSGVWQVKFNDRRCVAAVQRDNLTYIEVLDFGATRDGEPADQMGKRIVVNRRGQEVADDADEEYELFSDG